MLYFSVLFCLKNEQANKQNLKFRYEIVYSERITEFGPQPICEGPSRTQSQNTKWPKTGPVCPLELFWEQPRISAKISVTANTNSVPQPGTCNTLGRVPNIFILTEEYIDYFWLQKFWPPEIQNIIDWVTILWGCLLSWFSPYLLRSPFWQNLCSLVWMGSHSGSSSHRRSKFPDRKNSSGLLKMNLVMQYPYQGKTADLRKYLCPH